MLFFKNSDPIYPMLILLYRSLGLSFLINIDTVRLVIKLKNTAIGEALPS